MDRPVTRGIALVTGRRRGSARRACAFSKAGHQVALVSRDEEGVARGGELAAGRGARRTGGPARPAAIDAAFARVEVEWGPVEILVVNAGAAMSAPLVRTTDEDWQRMLDLNLTAPFRCLRRALPAMTDDGVGRVVVIASIAGKVGSARIAAYTASKHGVLGLVRAAAVRGRHERRDRERRMPGYVDTPMTDQSVANIATGTGRSPDEAGRSWPNLQPIGRLVTTEEVAAP